MFSASRQTRHDPKQRSHEPDTPWDAARSMRAAQSGLDHHAEAADEMIVARIITTVDDVLCAFPNIEGVRRNLPAPVLSP